MKKRIEKLEDFASDAKERLVRLETRADGFDARLSTSIATKTDVSDVKEALSREVSDVKDDVSEVKQVLARVVTRIDGIDERLSTSMATKAQVSEAKVAVILACISTMIALAGLVFGIARYVK